MAAAEFEYLRKRRSRSVLAVTRSSSSYENYLDGLLHHTGNRFPQELITDSMAEGYVTPLEGLERQFDSFRSSTLQLALLDPSGRAQQAAWAAPPVRKSTIKDYLDRAKNNVGPLYDLLLSFGVSVIYSIVYWIFIYFVLIRGNI